MPGSLAQNDESSFVDLSAKYLWSRVGGKSTNVVGDSIDFKAINSHRIRVGAMFNRQYSDSWNLAMGIAYEQEFDSKAKASTNGADYNFAIDAPSVRGGTGILTLKASTRPRSEERRVGKECR